MNRLIAYITIGAATLPCMAQQNDIEDDIKALSETTAPNEWTPKDTFVYLAPQLNILLKKDHPSIVDTTNYYGDLFIYEGISTITDWHNKQQIVLNFSSDNANYRFHTNRSLASFNDSTYNPLIPGLYPLSELRKAQILLTDRYFFIKTDQYKPLTQPTETRKFIEVKIDSLSLDSIDSPVRIYFSDKKNQQFTICTRLSNSLQPSQKHNFEEMFATTDPREQYKDITDKRWNQIQAGEIDVDMTQQEVLLSIGKPTRRDRQPTYSGMRETWEYQNGTLITFQDSRVTQYRK